MKFSKKQTEFRRFTALAAAVFFLPIVSSLPAGRADAAAAAKEKQSAVVSEVLTGDTVRLQGGKILRYSGLEAPAIQSKLPLVREYGKASLDFNRSLVEGKTVEVEWDSQIRDKHGDLLGYIYLPDGTLVNREILEKGHAKAAITPPNTRHAGMLREAELVARRQKAGLWREEPENPYLKSEFLGDPITKTYYLPSSPELERIPAGHLQTFRSRIEAVKAGFRPCDACRSDAPTEI
jgi:endonuclease YncB( thermonuclease family)